MQRTVAALVVGPGDQIVAVAIDRDVLGHAPVSEPFGPLTETCDPSIVTSTPEGTGMGVLPIRDMAHHT